MHHPARNLHHFERAWASPEPIASDGLLQEAAGPDDIADCIFLLPVWVITCRKTTIFYTVASACDRHCCMDEPWRLMNPTPE